MMNRIKSMGSMKLSMQQAIPLFALACSLGLGMFKVTLLISVVNIFSFRSQVMPILRRIKFGGWIFIALVVTFLLLYWVEYVPYQPERFTIEAHYFKMLFILSACVMIMPYCSENLEDSLRLIWYFGLGAFAWSACTVMASVLLSDPPYYGKIVDLRSLARGILHFGNTPGIASLLVFFPVISLSVFALLKPRQETWFWAFSLIGILTSIVCAILIQQRSFFVIALIIQPLIVAIFALFLGKYKKGILLLCILFTYPLLYLFDFYSGIGYLDRKLDHNLFFDARVQMLQFWLEQMLVNPLGYSAVGPSPWDSLPHFHNFFADVHRVSNLWALCAAVILIGYIFARLVILISRKKELGLCLMAIALPIFLVMISSVVPEGEKQPFLLFLLIGGVTEMLLVSKNLENFEKSTGLQDAA